ncbi:hypothetical protein HBH70_118060 [Parastagonospora nodorum]|nr:hypothetical protein HBH53_176920 [Parastagonospora nodorum]KAH4029339.1 hypothetical protein HBI09_132030 [Parastagonospora nodorum]KAH4063904.1 hypothetical protein HBH50_188200 [Parastagonospora nodorum]KAH4079591.1 hypothetical protein HBH48_216020 [Parastagonospora nodorum]KAH4080240.1 hypothetical protein HBH46_231470 [Parastagonospora nodorum]
MKFRVILEEYNQALYYYSQIQTLEAPGMVDLGYMQQFLMGPRMPYPLIGLYMNIWGEVHEKTQVKDVYWVASNVLEL